MSYPKIHIPQRLQASALCVAFITTSFVIPATVLAAEERYLEEVIVTARQRKETLQDVPVTVAAFTEEMLDQYNITTLTEASKLIPNFNIFHGGSGNGSSLYLRGIGSSSISAAFDQSVAINIDGVVVNIGRFIHNSYMDMNQLEVLKGPQSLYFGKSATAGVVSVTSNDPGDEFEFQAMVGYESEYDQTFTEVVISGPLSDTFGARLAFGTTDSDELFENLVPDVKNKFRGEESTNLRLTLVWEPNDDFRARLKYSYSEYDNDGANGRTEEICPEGTVQPTTILSNSVIIPGIDDCKLNGNTSIADLNPLLRAGLPFGGDDGVPFLEQETDFFSLQLDWQITDSLSLTSITGVVDLQHTELDIYDYNVGVFGGLHRNTYESTSQEFRLSSSFDSSLNFMIGAYFQDVEQTFLAFQYAANIGFVAPDPATGNAYDYNKNHFLDTEVFSAFFAGYWDITDTIELTAGLRYTDEEKRGKITIPYVHAFLQGVFGAPPLIDNLDFDDDNISPEVAVNWYVTDDISVFAAYKEGFKSGGIDNSALPTASLDPNQNPDFPDFLIYQSEEAKGFEIGMKANLLGGAMRLNGTVFTYAYDDLQVQLFDATAIQFETFNASELTTNGIEFDLLWSTEIEGLTLRGTLALTNTEYTDDFITATGENLKGEDGALNADVAGSFGLIYDIPLGAAWRLNMVFDARYSDSYAISATLDPFEQDSFWITDAAISLYSEDDRYEIKLIARNMGDEIYAFAAGARPGACPQADLVALTCFAGATANQLDQVVTTSLGRQITLQFRLRL